MTQTIPAKKNFFNQSVDLMNGPIFKSLFIFMLPIFVSNLFQQLYNTVDTMIVGNVLGDTALAAIGSCGSIYELLVGFAMAMRGISVKANIFRAAVCPAMTSVPSPLMPYCSTTEPAETMLLMRPMEMLWLNRSQ